MQQQKDAVHNRIGMLWQFAPHARLLSMNSLGFSNMKETLSASSSAFIVMTSSLPAHFRILDSDVKLTPRDIARSQRNRPKQSGRSKSAHNDTWDESMAYFGCINNVKASRATNHSNTAKEI